MEFLVEVLAYSSLNLATQDLTPIPSGEVLLPRSSLVESGDLRPPLTSKGKIVSIVVL